MHAFCTLKAEMNLLNVNMKKFLLFMVVIFCSLTMSAENFAYLVFTNTNGAATVLSAAGLTMNVNGNSLEVTSGTTHTTFTLTELREMQFSNDPTAIDNVLDANQPVQVFTPTGVCLGTFESLLKAAGSLDKGVYVITNGKNSQTIVLQ